MSSRDRIPQTEVPFSYVDRIREHVEREEVGAARRLVAEALREGSTEPGLANWERLLAPGKVLGFSPASDTDRSAEFRWFAEHGREYRGQWVAVLGEQMLAHARVYEDLRAELDKLRPAAPPLVHFIEGVDEMPSPARIPQTDVPVSYVDRIRKHVEREEVGAARRLVTEALRAGSTDPGLANWERLLAPGKVLGLHPTTGTDVREDVRWFDEHGQEYRGQWVAVLKGEMLAHAGTLEELQVKLAKLRPTGASLVHFVE